MSSNTQGPGRPFGTNPTRRTFLASSTVVAAPSILKGAPAKRNVLFIACDDLTPRLGCYGDPAVKTPNLDRLARAGVRFAHNYCQFPLCCPSRTSLMTGLAPDTTKIWDNSTHFRSTIPHAVTISQLFAKNGYFTERAGKIYHYNNPSEIGTPGFDDAASWQQTANPAGYDRVHDEDLVTYYAPRPQLLPGGRGRRGPNATGGMPASAQRNGSEVRWARGGLGPGGIRIAQDGRTPVLPMSTNGDLGVAVAGHPSDGGDQKMTDFMVAESAIAMIEEHKSEAWFIASGFFRPHVPFIVPSKYFDLYSVEELQVPPFDPAELSMAPRHAYTSTNPNYGMNAQKHREAVRAHYAAISFVDAQVGRLLDALDRLDLAKNTTIVFWSDHGFMVGEHGQWQKMMLFEPSTHVPLIVAGAGVSAKGASCERTVEHLNIYPTLAEVCGLKGAPANLQGRSMAPLLANPNAPWDIPAVTQVSRRTPGSDPLMGYSLRTERYRYTAWADGAEGEELYDYQSDPREMRNLAGDANSAGLKAKLRTRLEQISHARGKQSTAGAHATAQTGLQ